MNIVHHINGVVVDVINARNDITLENLVVVENIPTFKPQDGFYGILMYGADGLYWAYKPISVTDEISDSEALSILTGGV